MTSKETKPPAKLKRTLTLPLLVFYGVGVTVGAGIFALIGEVLALAGDQAPLSFLLAGMIAGVTGISYALLIRRYPVAGGEAVFVNRGLGSVFARLAGFGVVATGIISSAAIALAFAGYVQVFLALPETLLVFAIILILFGIAWFGVRESVAFAALVTLVEVGTLIVVIVFGLPLLSDYSAVGNTFVPSLNSAALAGIVSGGVLAFFAFIGFEDIVNMSEETQKAERTVPLAVVWTLGITLVIYVVLAVIAALAANREAITSSSAPLAALFESVSGLSGKSVAAMATIAMVNGILVQIVMASRVLYGMANEGLAPQWFAKVDDRRQTPARATLTVALIVLGLALFFPLVRLAEATSLFTLSVFALVNLALFAVGGQIGEGAIHQFRWWGILGAAMCLSIAGFQIFSGVSGGH
ncbi:APC family permease [Labrenzia sp. PHM005]|uniref:APC family permease n=1 Tax=Labrenzia sp. PHM005 TaxID=2590016 RepID=UPI0011403E54|nr:amino acid permease [Labrenzia sp. PHM005]QDG78139.1 amino acid permease [Labrenzia sp. PHM005]